MLLKKCLGHNGTSERSAEMQCNEIIIELAALKQFDPHACLINLINKILNSHQLLNQVF